MLRKFTEGLMFGSGFAIAFIALWYLAAYLISPMFISSQIENATNRHLADIRARIEPSLRQDPESALPSGAPFRELDLDEQIRKSSVIALAVFEPSSDGRMKAVIKEFLKKESGVTVYYDLGDEHAPSSHFPEASTDYGDGVIIFFTGSPAVMQMSMSYSGDRIRGLADMPLELFRQQCRAPDA